MVPARTLEAGDTIDGKAVECAFLNSHVEHREGANLKMGGNPWLHPDHHLALWLQRTFILSHEPMRPGTSRQHQARCLIRPARGPHHDAVPPAFPALQRFTAMDVGAVAERGIDVGHNTTLGSEQATLGLIEAQEGGL
jgi:hypothetical protein